MLVMKVRMGEAILLSNGVAMEIFRDGSNLRAAIHAPAEVTIAREAIVEKKDAAGAFVFGEQIRWMAREWKALRAVRHAKASQAVGGK